MEVASAAAAVRTKPSSLRRSIDFSEAGRSESRSSSKIVLWDLCSGVEWVPRWRVVTIWVRICCRG